MTKKLIASFILLMFALACLPVVSYAWFTYTFVSSSIDFSTDKLAPHTELYYWNKVANQWTAVPPASQGNHLLYPNLGVIDNLNEVPEDFDLYLKVRVDDSSGAVYNWNVTVADIEIIPLDNNGVEIIPSPENLIGLLDYYGGESEEDSQKCFYFSTALEKDYLDPTTINTYQSIINLDEKNQSLQEDFVSSEKWLYVHITTGINELQNIIRLIPLNKMPYMLEFAMTITGEGRTVN